MKVLVKKTSQQNEMISGGHIFVGRSLTSGMQSLSISCLGLCVMGIRTMSYSVDIELVHSLHPRLKTVKRENARLVAKIQGMGSVPTG